MMGLDNLGKGLNDLGGHIGDGVKQAADAAQKGTAAFHKHYIAKLTPDLGKFNGVAKFATEMAPGVSEYNALKAGDWVGLAVAAGLDLGATAAGAMSGGAGFVALKGGSALGKATLKTASKEVAEAAATLASQTIAGKTGERVVTPLAENVAAKSVTTGIGLKRAGELLAQRADKTVLNGIGKDAALGIGEVAGIKSGLTLKNFLKTREVKLQPPLKLGHGGKLTVVNVAGEGFSIRKALHITPKFSKAILDAGKHAPEQFSLFRKLGLYEGTVNGRTVLKNPDLDHLTVKTMEGLVTREYNILRMKLGLAPIGRDGHSMELHHIGQSMDSPLAELTYTEHRANKSLLTDFEIKESRIDRKAFNKEKRDYWKARAAELEKGMKK